MNKQFGDKATITNTIDLTKPAKDQLGDQDLEKVTGGTDPAPKETVTFEYGALQVRYVQQNVDGK
jgi:hypothetical protein